MESIVRKDSGHFSSGLLKDLSPSPQSPTKRFDRNVVKNPFKEITGKILDNVSVAFHERMTIIAINYYNLFPQSTNSIELEERKAINEEGLKVISPNNKGIYGAEMTLDLDKQHSGIVLRT